MMITNSSLNPNQALVNNSPCNLEHLLSRRFCLSFVPIARWDATSSSRVYGLPSSVVDTRVDATVRIKIFYSVQSKVLNG